MTPARQAHPHPAIVYRLFSMGSCLLFVAGLCRPAQARDPLISVEKAVGRQAERVFRATLGGVNAPLLNAWVGRIGQRVAVASGYRDTDVRFILIDTSIANAYTMPGGRILVTRGLLETVRDDDELAGILAHEMAHAARRHPRRQIAQAGAALAAMELLKPRNPHARLALTAAAPLAVLAFSRRQESEADRLGLDIAARAGYDPRGQMAFLRRLNEGQFPEWLATHPAPAKRRARLERRIAEEGPALLVATGRSFAHRGLFRKARRTYHEALQLAPGHAGALAGLSALPSERTPLPPPAKRLALPPSVRGDVRRAAGNVRDRLDRAKRGVMLASGLQTMALARAIDMDAPTLVLSAATYAQTERLNDTLARMVRVASRGPMALDRLSSLPAGAATPAEIESIVADVRAGEAGVTEAAGLLGLADAALNADWIALQAGALKDDAAFWARLGGVAAFGVYAGDRVRAARSRAREAERAMAAARVRVAVLQLNSSDAALDLEGRLLARRLARNWLDGSDPASAPDLAGGHPSTSAVSDAYPEPGAHSGQEAERDLPLGRWCLERAAALSAPGKGPAAADSGPLATALEHILYVLEDEGLAL